MPCGVRSACTRSLSSGSPTGPRSRSGMRRSTRSTSSDWCSTRSSSRAARARSAEETFAAVPRVLRTLCLRGCEEVTADVVGDLAAVLASMRGGCCTGRWWAPTGGASARASAACGSSGSCSRATSTPPCARSCRRRCARPGGRHRSAAATRVAQRAGRGPTPPRYLSDALFAATTCEEGPLPWPRTTPVDAARCRLRKPRCAPCPTPCWALRPHHGAVRVARRSSSARAGRPLRAEPRLPDGPFPAVPTLVLAGEDDLRTPLEAARRIAGRIPGATLISAPETGHSVLSGFPRRCGLRAADDFFAGRPVRPCLPRAPVVPSPATVPALARPGDAGAAGRRQARAHDHGGGPHAGRRTRPASSASLFAGFEQNVLRVGGLRAGYVRAGEETLEMHGVVYVPGVRVRGQITFSDEPHGALRITGHAAARGRLVFRRDGSVTGKLGGRRVRVTAAASSRRATRSWREAASGASSGASAGGRPTCRRTCPARGPCRSSPGQE